MRGTTHKKKHFLTQKEATLSHPAACLPNYNRDSLVWNQPDSLVSKTKC